MKKIINIILLFLPIIINGQQLNQTDVKSITLEKTTFTALTPEKITVETPNVYKLYQKPQKELQLDKKEVKVEETNKKNEPEIQKELFDPTPYVYNLKAEKKVKGDIYSDGLLYCYQVASFKDKAVAEKEVKKIKNKGFNAYVTQAVIKKVTWFRVRIGDFDTLADAEKSLKNYKKVFNKK